MLEIVELMGLAHLPDCLAKTPYSFTDQSDRLGAPTDFTIHVSEIRVSKGAGFLVVLTGSIMTMPGLPKRPAAEAIHLDENGAVLGMV
jgi:formate--tetrahydrofolate ligase